MFIIILLIHNIQYTYIYNLFLFYNCTIDGICMFIFRYVYTYEEASTRVREIEDFCAWIGVRQGSTLNPYLLTLITDKIIKDTQGDVS